MAAAGLGPCRGVTPTVWVGDLHAPPNRKPDPSLGKPPRTFPNHLSQTQVKGQGPRKGPCASWKPSTSQAIVRFRNRAKPPTPADPKSRGRPPCPETRNLGHTPSCTFTDSGREGSS